MSRKKTTEEFTINAKLIHGDFYDYSKVNYKNNSTKVIVICKKHGDFLVRPNDHLNKKSGCPICNNSGKSKILNTEKKIVDRFNEIHNFKYRYDLMKYYGTDIKIEIICKKHGVFKQTPHHHLSGSGCQECKGVKKMNTETFIKKSKKHHGFYDYSKVNYKNNSTKVIVICKKHGDFLVRPNDHLNKKSGCPICKESKGEGLIREYLDKENIIYIPQKRFKKCRDKLPLPFDFYLPKYNLCIEYDGEQHFKPISCWGGIKTFKLIKKRDNIKNVFCEENNINLLRISFNENIIKKLRKNIN